MTNTGTPAFLTQKYLENLLKNYYHDEQLKLCDYQLQPALGKGENYGAVLTRIYVKYQRKTKENAAEVEYLIAKSKLENEDALSKEKRKDFHTYERELSIYKEVLPRISALLAEIGITEQICPTVFYADTENMALVFEDLTARDYRMAERLKRLDLAHIKLILKKLAKFHAASAELNARSEQKFLEKYDKGFFNRHTDGFRSYFLGCFTAAANYLATQPGYEHYAQKMYNLTPNYMEIGKRCFDPTPTHINVLTHGDLWTNNMMFKYNEKGVPIDLLFLDFQYSFWGSPTLDLHHLFNTSMVEELLYGGQDMLLKYFYEEFTNCLEKLNYEALALPSLRQFHIQAEQKRFFAVHCAVNLQAVLLNEDSTDADFCAFLSEDERGLNFKRRLYTNPVIQRSLKCTVPMFDALGLLDADQ